MSSRHSVQNGSAAPPVFSPVGTGSPLHGAKEAGAWSVTTYLHLVRRLRMRGAIDVFMV